MTRNTKGRRDLLSPTLWEVADARLSRRGAMKGMLALAGSVAAPAWLASSRDSARAAAIAGPSTSTLTFQEVVGRIDQDHHVAAGYRAEVLIRWGDPLWSDAPHFDAASQAQAAQLRQFGYNNDFLAFMPLPRGSQCSDHGLLCSNHEYTSPHLMWPGLKWEDGLRLSQARCEVEMAAHGHSIIEVKRIDGRWRVIKDSPFTRRFSASGPLMRISGPAAGHPRLFANSDPTGMVVRGTLNNCAGGITPWGTVLIAEENFNKYFGEALAQHGADEARNFARLGIGQTLEYAWHRHFDRFNLARDPFEANRFGWFVEIDPYDPESIPVKRTALGRFKHEGASLVVNDDGRVVVYCADDERNEYVYRFVSDGRFDPAHPSANRELLDSGTLSVARFHANGALTWLPLVFGTGPLTPENDFTMQADVLIEARRAADLLGATPMDRPEDIEANPVTGTVFVMLTNNPKRAGEKVDGANPRAGNRFGHIVELVPPGAPASPDHASDRFRWELFLLAGDPRRPEHGAVYHPAVSRNGWLACPDNAAIDHKGRLWIATDQGDMQRENGIPDGLWATDTSGEGRALTRLFYAVPTGAEMCGPCFTPDCTTLFVSVQHPGEDVDSTFDTPSTRWPDFRENVPPRPAVVAITKDDGGEIGG
jgi:secreted PhoX family phosphatase